MAAPIDQTQQNTVRFDNISYIYFGILASSASYGLI